MAATSASCVRALLRHNRWQQHAGRPCVGEVKGSGLRGSARPRAASAADSGTQSQARSAAKRESGGSASESRKDVWQKSDRSAAHGSNSQGNSATQHKQGRPGNRPPGQGQGQRRRRGTPEPREQIVFEGASPREPHVAVLGGGVSGLACAQALAENGIRSTVFDTGRHGLGGRMGTREVYIDQSTGRERKASGSPDFVFDHAAQFFTVSDPRFAATMEDWLRRGWVRAWDGCVGRLQPGGNFHVLEHAPNLQDRSRGQEAGAVQEQEQEVPVLVGVAGAAASAHPGPGVTPSSVSRAAASATEVLVQSSDLQGSRFIASRGMRALCDELGSAIAATGLASVERPIWITKMIHTRASDADKWRLIDEHGVERGYFDFVVIAHNGKCANRLLIPSGVPMVAQQMMRLQLNSIWCSMVAFAAALPVPASSEFRSPKVASGNGLPHRSMEAAFVEGLPALAWMCNNTAKLALHGAGQDASTNGSLASPGPHECWTLFSSAAYGKANKVPQERIPAHVADRVKSDMLQAVCQALGIAPADLPPVLHHRVQLWGAALPLNAPQGVEFICDGPGRVGMCGDWLISPSVEAAVISGKELAVHIGRMFHAAAGTTDPSSMSVGLEVPLDTVEDAHDIGFFR